MSEYVSNLQDLAQQWGNAFSKHHGTTCEWVDLHATHHGMQQYQKYKIAAKTQNVRYEGSSSDINLPGVVVTDTTTNDSSVAQKSTFKRTKSTTTSFTWTVKEGLDIGISEEVEVGVPSVASSKVSLSANLSLESTQGKTETETETWEIDREVAVPPHSEMEMTWTIKEKKILAMFYADLTLTGYIAIWNHDKIDGNSPDGNDRHWLWFIPITMAFNQMREWGLDVPSQYSVGNASVTYHASGVCEGEFGFNTTFHLKQINLKDQRSKTITANAIPALKDY